MCIDLGAPLDRERPRRGLEAQIEAVERNERQRPCARGRKRVAPGQASIAPSITTTALPPIEAPVSLPPAIFSVSSIRLARPIS